MGGFPLLQWKCEAFHDEKDNRRPVRRLLVRARDPRLSAATILRNLSRDKYDVLSVGITKSGRWFLTKAAPEQVENGEWENHPSNCQAFLTPDRSIHGLFLPASGRRCASTR